MNIYAELDSIDTVVDTEIESSEVVSVEAIQDVLPEETAGIEVEILLPDEIDGEQNVQIAVEDVDTLLDAAEVLVEEEFQTETEIITILTKDVVLVLDNSGSMKKNDPNFLVNNAVKEFIRQQDENTRVGIVIFGQDVRFPIPLTDASLANRELLLNTIEEINYKGLFTDSPAAIERAIYELKNNGRDDAQKSIIFMTDGIVDTGVPERDLEKSKWLREDLVLDAADNEIKIFAIAFTDAADFQLIQSISQRTEGEYYRALTVDDLPYVFEQINEIINTPPEPEVVEVIPVEPVVVQPVTQPAPVIIEVPVQMMGEEERIRSIIIIAAAIVLTITLLGILILLLRRNRELKAGENEFVQDVYINDLEGKTDKQTHKLGTKPTMLGRVAGKDTGYLDYIVVNEPTIGRRHALIEFKDYSFWIVDQGSINGTFVNEQLVNCKVRLKHGDRIRLHKCNFEFIMPEMEDSGMTVMSDVSGQTKLLQMMSDTFAAQPAIDVSDDITQLRDGGDSPAESDVVASADMDFDITGEASDDALSGDLDDDDETNSDDATLR